MSLTVLQQFRELFGSNIEEGYGLSETSPIATHNQEVFGRKVGSVGSAIWGCEVQVADADLHRPVVLLPSGAVGEVVIRGHNVMKGYLDDPAATQAAIVDGWFRTGDLGTRDPEGFITLVDRKKDLVNRGGFKVVPREVEEVLMSHPAIAAAAVFAVADRALGEEVAAAVVVRSGYQQDQILKNRIIAWCSERLASYKYPRRVEFLDALPLGPSGKVLKRQLVDRFAG